MKIDEIKNIIRGRTPITLEIMREFAVLILLTEKEWQTACESSERQTGAIGVIRTWDS